MKVQLEFEARRMPEHGTLIDPPIINQPVCFFSTPEYLNTLWGWYRISYCMGSAQLTKNNIFYRSKEINFDLPLSHIMDMSIGTFERTKGVFHLDYLALTFNTNSGVRTILLMPARSRFSQTWTINKSIRTWFNTICELKGQNYEMYRPYPQSHDWPDNITKRILAPKKEINDDSIRSELSVIPRPMQFLCILVVFLLMISFTVSQGFIGFLYGLLISIFFVTTTYMIFWFQSKVLGFIRKNKDNSIIFKMWTEFENGDFLEPFHGKK